MHYFAFGSNMLSARLRARVGEIPPGVAGRITGYQLRFHKRSGDGSGKCDAYRTNDPVDAVHGVVYHISAAQQVLLDSFEGAGYDRVEISVAVRGDPVDAFLYVADPDFIDPDLAPYHWYKQFVVTGAREFALPKGYLHGLAKVPAVADPDSERHVRNMRLISMGAPIQQSSP